MVARSFCVGSALLLVLGTACGGGSSNKSALPKVVIRERAIASARLMRAIFAVAALRHSRDVTQGVDDGTKLTFTRTVNAEGSGREDLYTDSARTKAAGDITWAVPIWSNNQPDTYPATIRATYRITAGEFAGDNGTLEIVPQDSAANHETIHLVLTNAHNERCVADFTYDNGKVSGKDYCTLADGTTCTEEDVTLPDGNMECTIVYSDNSQETLDMQTDGTTIETLDAPDGSQEASGKLDDNGNDNITYSDGSTETVDVDTDPKEEG